MKLRTLITASILLVVCLLIPGFLRWKLRDLFRAVNDLDATPMAELEAEEYSPDLSNKTMISGIEGNAEFKFPPSSRNIYAYTTGFQDIFIQTRFMIDADELQELISSTRCDAPLQSLKTPLGNYMSKFDWWDLSEAKTIMECSGSTEHFGQTVYVDITNTEIYIVYIEGGTH